MLTTKLPLVTTGIEIGGRHWAITAVQNQDALLDHAEDFENFPFGFLLWESAIGLARMLAANPALVAGRTVMELGAGVGVPGIVARSLGAQVWQTDHQPGALHVAQENARLNGVMGITQFPGDWRNWTHTTRYDVLLGADILYERDTHFYLERIFERCLAPGGQVLLADPGRPQAIECVALLEKHGWRVEMETCPVLLQQGQENRPVDVALWNLVRPHRLRERTGVGRRHS
jgi:predicted nicotinamide N-methyase